MSDQHICLVLSTATGGLPHYTAELANALSTKNKVTVLKPDQTTADEMFNRHVEKIEVFTGSELSFVNLLNREVSIKNVMRSFSSYRNIRKVKDIDPDIVHFTDNLFPPTKAFAGYYNIDDEYPVIVTLHEIYDGPFSSDEGEQTLYSNPSIAAGILGREALNYLTPNITPSQYVVHTENHKQQLISKGENSDHISVIPHGTYDVFENPDDSVTEEENTILCFGKIVPSKAIDTVVQAIPILQESIPAVKLIIAGEGEIPANAQTIIDKYPDSFEVRNEFVPNEEVGEYFDRAQVAIVPHRNQGGHSGTLTIAHSFGKPIVSSDVGELPNLVEGSGCGLTADPERPEEFAEAISTILQNPDLRERYARNSEKRGETMSWKSISNDYNNMYQNLNQDIDA